MATFQVLTDEGIAALSPRDAKLYFGTTPEEMRDAKVSIADRRIFNVQLAARVKASKDAVKEDTKAETSAKDADKEAIDAMREELSVSIRLALMEHPMAGYFKVFTVRLEEDGSYKLHLKGESNGSTRAAPSSPKGKDTEVIVTESTVDGIAVGSRWPTYVAIGNQFGWPVSGSGINARRVCASKGVTGEYVPKVAALTPA